MRHSKIFTRVKETIRNLVKLKAEMSRYLYYLACIKMVLILKMNIAQMFKFLDWDLMSNFRQRIEDFAGKNIDSSCGVL